MPNFRHIGLITFRFMICVIWVKLQFNNGFVFGVVGNHQRPYILFVIGRLDDSNSTLN
jgi:hypothetical protein